MTFFDVELVDVVDWPEVERMLDQHDRYEFGRLAVVRAALDPNLWYVYFANTEAHVVLGEPCKPFPGLASALEWGLAPVTLERLEEAQATTKPTNPTTNAPP